MTGLLDGVRVVETATLLPGAAAGMALADLGADVVKVEPPHGDLIRVLGQIAPGHSPAHLQLNRNKRGVTIDFRDDADRARWEALVGEADVLIDGNAVGRLATMGYDGDTLDRLNPRLIRCTLTGFGSVGPYADVPAHGLLVGALVGSFPGRGKLEGAALDGRGGGPALAAAWPTAASICAALYRREKSGVGAVIDVSEADALLAASMVPVVYYANESRLSDDSTLPALADGQHGPRYCIYDAADGAKVAFAALEPSLWARFCAAVGREDLLDAGYEGDRVAAEVAAVFAGRTREEWLSLAATQRLSIGPVHESIAAVLEDRQLSGRPVIAAAHHPVAGEFVAIGPPFSVDSQGFEIRRPAPALGQHNGELSDGWG